MKTGTSASFTASPKSLVRRRRILPDVAAARDTASGLKLEEYAVPQPKVRAGVGRRSASCDLRAARRHLIVARDRRGAPGAGSVKDQSDREAR